MYCVKCGTEIPDKSKFCPECGAKVVPLENVTEPPQQGTTEEKIVEAEESTIKAKFDEAVDSAKKAGKSFADSEAVQNAKKEVNDIFEEAKSASDIQDGTATDGGAVPREEVSFLVKWFFWTGRRDRFDYLIVAIVTSLASLALGSNPLISLLLCYISGVNIVKRLHDADHSGWFAFFIMLAEYVILNLTWLFGLLGLGIIAAGSLSGMFLMLIPLLIVWGIKLWIFFVPGTKSANRFGPVPK